MEIDWQSLGAVIGVLLVIGVFWFIGVSHQAIKEYKKSKYSQKGEKKRTVFNNERQVITSQVFVSDISLFPKLLSTDEYTADDLEELKIISFTDNYQRKFNIRADRLLDEEIIIINEAAVKTGLLLKFSSTLYDKRLEKLLDYFHIIDDILYKAIMREIDDLFKTFDDKTEETKYVDIGAGDVKSALHRTLLHGIQPCFDELSDEKKEFYLPYIKQAQQMVVDEANYIDDINDMANEEVLRLNLELNGITINE